MLWEETTEVGREQIMKETLNKQANKLFTFDFKYSEKPLEGFKQGSCITSFEF